MSYPSITQYFKPQRKRPRAGKEDGIVSQSKRLMLEEGVSVKKEQLPEIKHEKGLDFDNNSKISPTTLAGETTEVEPAVVTVNQPQDETKRFSEASSSATETEVITSKTFVPVEIEDASETPKSSEKDENLTEIPVESEHVSEIIKTSEETVFSPDKPVSSEPEVVSKTSEPPTEIITPSTAEEEDTIIVEFADDPRKTASPVKALSSPVKYFKLGALSPHSKKKMTSEQISKVLKKTKNLRDLKAALEGMNQCKEKLESFRRTCDEANARMSPLKKPDSLASPAKPGSSSKTQGMSPNQFYSPNPGSAIKSDLERLSAKKVFSSPSKLVNANNKIRKRLFDEQPDKVEEIPTTHINIPAYQRFQSLAQKTSAEKDRLFVDPEADLPLPYHFKVLKELFIGVETVAGIMKSRKEMITFSKLKNAVLELVKKVTLKEKHLAQIVTVVPGLYKFGLEKVGRETEIRIIVDDLVPSVVCARRKAFQAALIKICLDHHKVNRHKIIQNMI